jgi:hypothetical protein
MMGRPQRLKQERRDSGAGEKRHVWENLASKVTSMVNMDADRCAQPSKGQVPCQIWDATILRRVAFGGEEWSKSGQPLVIRGGWE